MRFMITFLLIVSLTFAHKTFSQIKHTVPLQGVGSPANAEDDWNPILFHKEMPYPGDSPDRIKLYEQKAISTQKFPRKPSYKNVSKSSVSAPTVLKVMDGNIAFGIPLDNYLAVGNDETIISVANTNFYWIDPKNDTIIKTNTLFQFTLPTGLTGSVNSNKFDPKVIYDPIENRYIALIINATNAANRIILAFSSEDDPTGIWNFYVLPGNPFNDTTWYDYPAISITETEFFFTGNQIRNSNSWQEGFRQTLAYQVNKRDGYLGNPLTYVIWNNIEYEGRRIRNLHPVKWSDEIESGRQYFLSNRNFAVENDTIFLVTVTDTIDSPNHSIDIKVLKSPLKYGVPPDGRQKDFPDLLATNDARVLGAFYKDGIIHFVGNSIDFDNGSAGIFHGKISGVDSANPQITANIISKDDEDFGYPNISYTGKSGADNDFILSFNHTGPQVYDGLSALYYTNGDYSPIVKVKEGTNSINILSGNIERWGDYSGSQVFYPENGAVWINGSYGTTNNRYQTVIAKLVDPKFASLSNIVKQDRITAKIFPNPSADRFYLEFNSPEDGNIVIELFDLNGRLVKTIQENVVKKGDNIFSFDTAKLNPGIYSLSIRVGSKIVKTEKLIKQ